MVSEKGIKPDDEKIEVVKNWPAIQNVKDLRKFLGFTSYYRKFRKDYGKIVKPLNDLLVGHCTNAKGKKKSKTKPKPWRWGDVEENAKQTIVEKLTSPPILAYADYNLPFIVYRDASGDGLGAILYQCQDGVVG